MALSSLSFDKLRILGSQDFAKSWDLVSFSLSAPACMAAMCGGVLGLLQAVFVALLVAALVQLE